MKKKTQQFSDNMEKTRFRMSNLKENTVAVTMCTELWLSHYIPQGHFCKNSCC